MTLETGKVRCRMVRRPLPETAGANDETATNSSTCPVLPPPTATPVISERVGVFSFGKRPPLAKGLAVKKGEVLGIIKGISIQDNVVAPRAGNLDQVNVKEGEIVEFGRVLFSLAPETVVASKG